MRKLLVFGVFLGILMVPASSLAVEPPIQNLAPSSGSTVQALQFRPVQVELGCPAYSSTKAGTGYRVQFATSAELNPEGNFATPFLAGSENAQPINAAEDICRANLPTVLSEYIPSPTTYYWRVERTSCPYFPPASEECLATGKGPIWSFTVNPPVKPTTPTKPSPSPSPTTPAAPPTTGTETRQLWVYVGCGTSQRTRPSHTCRKNQTIGAFLESTYPTRYTVCVRFPEGTSECARNQRAEAQTLYVNTIKKHKSGFYTVTWIVEGRHYVRRVHRTL